MKNVWFVYKTGATMFDQLHACGLAILLNCLTGSHVKMLDSGMAYQLETAVDLPNYLPDDLWQRLFPLPEGKDLDSSSDLALSVFDGLMALLFTSPGARLVSTEDAKWQVKYKPEVIGKGLVKARKAIERWQKFVSKQCRKDEDLLSNLHRCYSAGKVPSFRPAPKKSSGLSIPMTLDPIFSYATRQPVSDHLLSKKVMSLCWAHFMLLFLPILGPVAGCVLNGWVAI